MEAVSYIGVEGGVEGGTEGGGELGVEGGVEVHLFKISTAYWAPPSPRHGGGSRDDHPNPLSAASQLPM